MHQPVTVTIRGDIAEIARVNEVLDGIAEQHAISSRVVHQLRLTLDEVLTNIAMYGLVDQPDGLISVEFRMAERSIEVEIVDPGIAFDPLTEAAEPDIDALLEDRGIGGLGVFFMKKMMDDVHYARMDGRNRLTMRKNLDAA